MNSTAKITLYISPAMIICLSVLFITACTKDKKDSGNLETENSIQQSTNELLNYSDTAGLNKNILETEEQINNTEVINEDTMTFLAEYFQDENFQLFGQPLDVNHRKIKFAVHYINNDLLICDKIVGFEIVDGLFQRYLLVEDFRFINIDNSILFDFSKKYAGIYGFAILYSYPTVAGYTPGLYIDTYFDSGDRVADGITIMWNEDRKRFEESVW